MNKSFFTIGILGATAVALGALGAHALKNQLPTGLITQDQLNGFDTAARYQMYHALAMALVLMLNKDNAMKILHWAYRFLLIGIFLFSGSLYFLCTRNLLGADWLKFLGPVTPLGGLFFMAGWLCLAFAALKKS
ncbi:MAG: DUF423 domain-containing protein [Bacteroidia bacterium]|nr:DUF423 domain-containing protein [Bacteroidia bacterium]